MRRATLKSGWSFVLAAIMLLGCQHAEATPTGEENLLILRNGGMVCGVLPQIGGRVMVFRKENGDNVLDARPSQWRYASDTELLEPYFKQFYGESVWSGPQGDWWSDREPYPPPAGIRGGGPDPAWELAAFTVVEQTPTRIVLRSPVSKLTGLELTKTIELQSDGQLKLQEKAVNRGDRVVTRDLWLLHRVKPGSLCFIPLKSHTEEKRFLEAGEIQKAGDLTVLQLRTDIPSWQGSVGGKMYAVAQAGWMASTAPEGFFVVRFQATDEGKTAPNQSPVEVYFNSGYEPLFELEHHGEIKTLHPGEAMESEETWQIVSYTGAADTEALAKFLETEEAPTVTPVKKE